MSKIKPELLRPTICESISIRSLTLGFGVLKYQLLAFFHFPGYQVCISQSVT